MSTLHARSVTQLVLGSSILLALGAAGCCMGGSTPAVTAPMPVLPSLPIAPVIAAPMGTQAVTIGAGFVPDPSIVATTAGGGFPASTLATPDVYCAGNIGALPNVTLTTTTPIAGLRVLVRSTADTTLAIRLSDGRVLCNDDGGGYPNPAVQADFPAGVHQVYVGAFHDGETPAATVAFTTNPALMNDSLP